MGGYGSGRTAGSLCAFVEECFVIDASDWRRQGILQPGLLCTGKTLARVGFDEIHDIYYRVDTRESASHRVWLRHRARSTGEWMFYPVDLQWTKPHYGGSRCWFVCPLEQDGMRCLRRVAKLYMPRGGRYFGCRHCWKLSYRIRLQDASSRGLLKAKKIRRRLGGSANLLLPFPLKPPGMRGQKYEHLREQSERLVEAYAVPLEKRLQARLAHWDSVLKNSK